MPHSKIENWLHASDEEREEIHANWDINNNEGKDIAEEVASLLIKECIYDIHDVSIVANDGQWHIQAYADSDYESLKDRGIVFLGFKLNIKQSAS